MASTGVAATGASGEKKTSKELLSITGDGSSKSVVQNLLRKPASGASHNKTKTFKIGRSPLLDQVEMFLPQFRSSTQELLDQPEDQRQKLDIEDTTQDTQVVEMNLFMGEMSTNEDGSDSESLQSPLSPHHTPDSNSEDSSDQEMTGSTIRITPQARKGGKKGKSLIVEVEVEGERSDGEVTIASTSSGER